MGIKKEEIKKVKITKPNPMEYNIHVENDKDKQRLIDSVKRIVRSSMEYRDYVNFLKEHMDLNSCIFFEKVTSSNGGKRSKVSIEIHHEPFTLQDYVSTVIDKYIDTGEKLNDLLIADEVLRLHYENKVGLVPLSKTMHQMVHNSTKIDIPLFSCYGNYSEFIAEYEQYVSDEMYAKLERKINQTNNITPESFDAIKKVFTYVEVSGFDDLAKMETSANKVG